MLLLDIPGQVPSSFKTFRVGYDATAAPPRRAVGIHHPNGNVKRISYANDTCAHMLLSLGHRLVRKQLAAAARCRHPPPQRQREAHLLLQ